MKKVAVFLIGVAMVATCSLTAGATTNQSKTGNVGLEGEVEWGYLNIVDQNIRIKAPESDILKYVNADNDDEEKLALEQLLSDPNNTVSDMDSSALALVPETEADTNNIESEACLPSPERKPGKWTIGSGSVVVAGGAKRYFPSGQDAMDVAYDETVHLVYRYAGNRCVSAECAESTPSIYYDPECRENGFQEWWSKLPSGQYSIYIKNYSKYDLTTVSGGYFEVYE